MPQASKSSENSFLRMMVRDPSWVFAYWEISEDMVRELKSEIGFDKYNYSDWTIRLWQTSTGEAKDVDIEPSACNWYINVKPGCSYEAAIGLVLEDGSFKMVIKGNMFNTPGASVSEEIDEEWPISDEKFYKVMFPQLQDGFSSSNMPLREGPIEWATAKWPLSPSVSSHDAQKKNTSPGAA
jgi:hypothetical protein